MGVPAGETRKSDDKVSVGAFAVIIITLIAVGTFSTVNFALFTAIPWLGDLNEIVEAYRSTDGLILPYR